MRHLLCTVAGLLAFALPGVADDEKSDTHGGLPAKEAGEGWIKLFDGATTFGWKIDGKGEVKDGALVLGGAGETTATTTAAFKNAELGFDYSVEGNGRVTFAGTPMPDPKRKGTIQINLSNTAPVRVQVPAGVKLTLQSLTLKPLGLGSIFNGKDLTGWKVIPGKKSVYTVTPRGEMNVKNGNGDIQSEGQWDDFVLQIDVFSNGPHLNSGVFFRCQPGEFWSGYEAQVRNEWVTDVVLKDGTKLSGSYTPKGDQVSFRVFQVNGKQARQTNTVKTFPKSDVTQLTDHRDIPIDYGTGGLYNRQPARKVVSSDYEWFTMTVVANGKHIGIWVNGYQTADYTDTRPDNASARNGTKVDKGPVSLQGHDPTTDLSFRNIRIAALPKSGEK